MVDKNLILRKITELERYLSQVMEFSDLTVQGYKADWKTQRIVERTLQMMIETCTDIANLADFKEFKEAVLGYLRGHKALLKSTGDKKTRREEIA